MVQKSTRKGWALALVASLFTVGLGASPASAAGEVTLAPSAGTSYTTLVDQSFTLDAGLGAGVNNSFTSQLKYHVANADGATLSYTVSGVTNAYSESGVTSTSFVVSADANATTATSIEISLDGVDTSSDTVEIVVTAFVDADNRGDLDAGEWQQARTVTFLTYADAEATVVVSAIAEGDTELEATVSGLNFNREQLGGSDVDVQFYVNGAASGSAVAIGDDLVATKSGSVVADATVSAVVEFAGHEIGDESDTVDTNNKTIDTVTASAVTGNNVVDSESGQVTARINSAFSVMVTTATSSSETVVGAIAGTYAVTTTATLSSTITLKIAGVTYDDNDDLPTAAAFVTDADGEAAVALHPTGFSTSDTVTVTFTAQNIDASVVASQQVAAYTVENVDGDYAFAAPGGTVALKYEVKDQWDVLSAEADRLKITASGTAFVVATQYVSISGGKATVNITGNPSTISGDVLVSATLQEQDSATKNWSDDATATSDADVTVKFTTATPAFSVEPASDSASVSGLATISGKVSIEGAVVTITGAGLVFENAAGATASGVITVRTAANGLFTVSATSNVVGEYDVTVSVGTYSEEIVITVDPVDSDAGTTLVATTAVGVATDGKYYATPGSTIQAKFTLTDDYGNAVEATTFSVTVTGPGFVGTKPTSTDADGMATLNVLTGGTDTGSVVFTATYTPSSGAEDAVSVVLTVIVGSAPAAVVPDQKLTVGTFKGYVAIFTLNYTGQKLSAKIAGKWLVEPSLNRYQMIKRNTGAGYTAKVDLYIDGAFVRSETIVTK